MQNTSIFSRVLSHLTPCSLDVFVTVISVTVCMLSLCIYILCVCVCVFCWNLLLVSIERICTLCVMCVGGLDRWICVKSPFLNVSGSDILFVSLSVCVCDVIIVKLDWWSYIIATATSAAVTGQEIEPLLFAIFVFLPLTDTKTHTQILGRISKIQYRSKSMWTQDHHTCIYWCSS